MFYFWNKRSLTLIEFLTVLCISLIFIGTLASYFSKTLRIARETALMAELNNVRMSLEYYRIINKEWPKELSLLCNKNLTFTNFNDNFISLELFKPYRVDKKGCFLDPFMNKYVYDKSTGKVKTETVGYEKW